MCLSCCGVNLNLLLRCCSFVKRVGRISRKRCVRSSVVNKCSSVNLLVKLWMVLVILLLLLGVLLVCYVW